MLTITIRDKALADEDSSPYLVLVQRASTAYTAYKTIAEFMDEWWDTLAVLKMSSLSFTQKALCLIADYTIKDMSVYTKDLDAMDGKVRYCDLLSNGSVQRGAILVDSKNKQTTFFRLNPNDKEYKR